MAYETAQNMATMPAKMSDAEVAYAILGALAESSLADEMLEYAQVVQQDLGLTDTQMELFQLRKIADALKPVPKPAKHYKGRELGRELPRRTRWDVAPTQQLFDLPLFNIPIAAATARSPFASPKAKEPVQEEKKQEVVEHVQKVVTQTEEPVDEPIQKTAQTEEQVNEPVEEAVEPKSPRREESKQAVADGAIDDAIEKQKQDKDSVNAFRVLCRSKGIQMAKQAVVDGAIDDAIEKQKLDKDSLNAFRVLCRSKGIQMANFKINMHYERVMIVKNGDAYGQAFQEMGGVYTERFEGWAFKKDKLIDAYKLAQQTKARARKQEQEQEQEQDA